MKAIGALLLIAEWVWLEICAIAFATVRANLATLTCGRADAAPTRLLATPALLPGVLGFRGLAHATLDAEQEIPWADQPLTYYKKYRVWFQEFVPSASASC